MRIEVKVYRNDGTQMLHIIGGAEPFGMVGKSVVVDGYLLHGLDVTTRCMPHVPAVPESPLKIGDILRDMAAGKTPPGCTRIETSEAPYNLPGRGFEKSKDGFYIPPEIARALEFPYRCNACGWQGTPLKAGWIAGDGAHCFDCGEVCSLVEQPTEQSKLPRGGYF